MTDKEAIAVLTEMLRKYPLDEKEQEAIKSSIGILGWTKMLENKLEARRKNRKETPEE